MAKGFLSDLGMTCRTEQWLLPALLENAMTDPRNIAHDKKVHQEKKHRHQEVAPGADTKPQPGKKTHMEHHASDIAKVPDEAAEEGAKPQS